MAWQMFQDSNGDTSFTRITAFTIVVFNLLLLAVNVIMNDGKLPTIWEASTIISLIGTALTGKVVQRPFEKPKEKECKKDA
ncbi:MAG: hypothetical protein AB7C95_00975 [Synergistaceae bacterium]